MVCVDERTLKGGLEHLCLLWLNAIHRNAQGV